MQAPPMPIAAATRALGADRLTLADLIARLALKERPSAPLACVRGKIAMRIGLTQTAQRHFAEALALDAGLREAAEALEATRSAPPRAAPGAERFLLIREWCQGFWSDTDHVLGGLLLAELSGRTPVVLWGGSSRYRNPGDANGFPGFFQPVSKVEPASLTEGGRSYWPPKWNESNLLGPTFNIFSGEGSRVGPLELWARDEDVVVADFHFGVKVLHPWINPDHRWHGLSITDLCRGLFESRLIVRDELRARAEDFVRRNLAGRPCVAIHVRAADKVHEVASFADDVNFMREKLAEYRADLPGSRVFLMTDSASIADDFRSGYGDDLVTTEAVRTARDEGLHFQKHPDRRRLGEDVLIDTLIAARCDRFVGDGWSNVACMVRHLKRWDDEHISLLPPFMHETISHLAFDPAFRLAEPRPVDF